MMPIPKMKNNLVSNFSQNESKQTNSVDEDINWNHVIYALGKLTDVIIILVEDGGDARWRLRVAGRKILKVKPSMLPSTADIRQRFEGALSALTKYHDLIEYALLPNDYPGTIFDSTLNKIRNRTASKVIGNLFGVWMDLQALYFENECERKYKRKRENPE